MQIGIVGLPLSGKTTIFNALTSAHAKTGGFLSSVKEPNRAVVKVPDSRIEKIASMFNPKKVTPAEIEYIDVAGMSKSKETEQKGKEKESEIFFHLRGVNALAHVIRCFKDENIIHPSGSINPLRDMESFDLDLTLLDLEMVEKRLSKVEKSYLTSKSQEEKREYDLLIKCKNSLEDNRPLRDIEFTAEEARLLSGYCFLSFKPILIILNTGEDDLVKCKEIENDFVSKLKHKHSLAKAICGKLEMEISQLEEKDRASFIEELGITEQARDKVISSSYELLGLISFFTANQNEVRAWAIPSGTRGLRAAGTVHTDMEKGFIKAEVINYDKLIEAGSMNSAKEKGLVRLEGKDYIVQDGDLIFFRFNV
ncbi:MAG: redox-regulated ATPase YchF [candidate division Zixibacteria bacterium]|nr:redox-regulated ATPase YchF [candidate division Zixibacteria bacterium]